MDIHVVFVLVFFAESRDLVLLAAEYSLDLASFLLAVFELEPRSAYERSDYQCQRLRSCGTAQKRSSGAANARTGSWPQGCHEHRPAHENWVI
jgi:hypothetical protein